MHQMVWYYLIGIASLEELEAFIQSRKVSATAWPRPWWQVVFAAARLVTHTSCSFESGVGRVQGKHDRLKPVLP